MRKAPLVFYKYGSGWGSCWLGALKLEASALDSKLPRHVATCEGYPPGAHHAPGLQAAVPRYPAVSQILKGPP